MTKTSDKPPRAKTAKSRASTKSGSKKKRASTRAGTRSGAKKKRAATKTVRSEPPAPDHAAVVSVFEKSRTHSDRARDAITALGYKLVKQRGEKTLLTRLRGRVPPDVAVIGMPGGDALLSELLGQGRDRPVIVASLDGPPATAQPRCAELGADLFALRPHSRDSLAPVLAAAVTLAGERRRIVALEGTEEMMRERLQRYGEADASTGFKHFDFFKQVLVMELKRAKRYGYSLAACLVALDPLDPSPPGDVSSLLRTRIASAIASCIRDIDLPVDYAEDRFLAFLPYTDLAGAEHVGKRIARAVASHGRVESGDGAWRATVSVGIAALKKGKPISFARIVRDAGAAVRAAQLKGGNRVVVRP